MAESNSVMARNELLIILDYLMEQTDEEHPTHQGAIVDYAKKNYGVDIRRQRVNAILEYLMEVTSQYPDKFPFIMEEYPIGQKKRYYISQRQFTNEEIIGIIHAIRQDKYTDDKESDDLVKRFLELTTNGFKRDEIKNLLAQEIKGIQKYSPKVLENMKKLEASLQVHSSVIFSLLSRKIAMTPVVGNSHDEENKIVGYVYKIVDFNHRPVALMVDVKSKKVLSCPIAKMKIERIVPWYDKPEEAPEIDALFKNKDYKTVEEFVNDAVMPEEKSLGISLVQFHFRYSEHNYYTISDLFKEFFKKDMPCKRVNFYFRKGESQLLSSAPTKQRKNPDDVCITFVMVTTTADVTTFVKWASSYEVGKIITVTGSHLVVRTLLNYGSLLINKTSPYDLSADWNVVRDYGSKIAKKQKP